MLFSKAVQQYGDSWRAIMHLVRSGYSWSGHERNSVFLNLGRVDEVGSPAAPRFAAAATVAGLDFLDDGRGVAVVDWDGDGDQDLWLRNRSAPRLRLMRNNSTTIASNDQSVSLKLIGRQCNHDAIGGRVELFYTVPGSAEVRLVRSVRAGDAFLSQSSKTLHFGIPTGAVVSRFVVSWPGGPVESFDDSLTAGQYIVEQGTKTVSRLPKRTAVQLAARPNGALPTTAAAPTPLPRLATCTRSAQPPGLPSSS